MNRAWWAIVYGPISSESDMTERLSLSLFSMFYVVLEKTLECPLDSKGIKPVKPKGNQSWILIERTNAEAWLLWPPDAKSWLIGKDLDAGKDWWQKEKRVTEDEMVGWYHWFNGHELGQTLEDGGGQRGLVCCSPWSCKELDTAWWLNNNELQWAYNEAQGLLKTLIFHHLGHGSNQSYGHVILFKVVLYPLPPVSAVRTSWLYCRSQPSIQWQSQCMIAASCPQAFTVGFQSQRSLQRTGTLVPSMIFWR